MAVFNETIIPLALVGYEMIIASLAIYRVISNAHSLNNCQENVKPILGAHAINPTPTYVSIRHYVSLQLFIMVLIKPLMRIVPSSDDKAQ